MEGIGLKSIKSLEDIETFFKCIDEIIGNFEQVESVPEDEQFHSLPQATQVCCVRRYIEGDFQAPVSIRPGIHRASLGHLDNASIVNFS